ncbi:MAG: methyltransferase domain-containing protein [Alphaproteobacteria bacterium]|nr:methyltransferase domain-containing protein [Alphaproteobacteria bacterium]
MFAASSLLRLPFDPVTLSYVMALRGVKPRLPKEGFTYAELGCGTGERIVLLAACNPEGVFFGFDSNLDKLNVAAQKAEELGVENITFSQASAAELKEAIDNGVIANKSFNYLVYNEPDNPQQESIATLGELAKALLQENGVFAYRYATYNAANADELLFKSLTRHIIAEQPDKGETLAKEWRALCESYFAKHPAKAQEFDKALAEGKGFQWLRNSSDGETSTSKTLQVSQIFSGRDLTYLGSANLSANYMELSAPEASHKALEAKRLHPLYESLKDLATGTTQRIDLWGREKLQRIDNLVPLFSSFTFGVTEPAEQVARTATFQGKTISFDGPLYDGVISMASIMPITMGDLVHNERLSEVDAVTILNTVQLLVACGILSPMRASFEGGIDLSNPKLVGSYNQSLRKMRADMQDYAFASVVTGRPVFFSGIGTLVLQNLDKGGMEGIAGFMSDDLMRLSQHPFLQPLNLNNPQRAAEEAYNQIEIMFQQSMVRWFSLGVIDTQKIA